MKTTLRVVAGWLVLASSLLANEAFAQAAPPVDFAVAKQDPSIFYPTRLLRKGDRFEINVHQLHDYNSLIVVPCHPDCSKPDFALAYPLHAGIQHLRIPTTGQYYFWLQRSDRTARVVHNGQRESRTALPVLDSQFAADKFVATYDRGTVLSMRTLYARPVAESIAPAG